MYLCLVQKSRILFVYSSDLIAEHARLWGNEGPALMQFTQATFAIGGIITPLLTRPFLAEKINTGTNLEEHVTFLNASLGSHNKPENDSIDVQIVSKAINTIDGYTDDEGRRQKNNSNSYEFGNSSFYEASNTSFVTLTNAFLWNYRGTLCLSNFRHYRDCVLSPVPLLVAEHQHKGQ